MWKTCLHCGSVQIAELGVGGWRQRALRVSLACLDKYWEDRATTSCSRRKKSQLHHIEKRTHHTSALHSLSSRAGAGAGAGPHTNGLLTLLSAIPFRACSCINLLFCLVRRFLTMTMMKMIEMTPATAAKMMSGYFAPPSWVGRMRRWSWISDAGDGEFGDRDGEFSASVGGGCGGIMQFVCR